MKMIAGAVAVLLLFSASWAGSRLLNPFGALVIGGSCLIQRGETVHGNLYALFAQVTLEDGARLDGKIRSLSSALDLGGTATGDVLAVGSDIRVRDTAHLLETPREVGRVPYVVLLPAMARMGGPR